MTGAPHGADHVAELRREFDESFAVPPGEEVFREDLLTVRVGGARYALRLTEISGLFADRSITPLPTAVPELLGLAGFRGSILPVYDLAALLAYPRETTPRWLVAAAGRAVGLAFGRFERHLRVRRDAIVPSGHGDPRRHSWSVVRLADGECPIISVAAVVDAIASRVAAGVPGKE